MGVDYGPSTLWLLTYLPTGRWRRTAIREREKKVEGVEGQGEEGVEEKGKSGRQKIAHWGGVKPPEKAASTGSSGALAPMERTLNGEGERRKDEENGSWLFVKCHVAHPHRCSRWKQLEERYGQQTIGLNPECASGSLPNEPQPGRRPLSSESCPPSNSAGTARGGNAACQQ